MTTPDPPAYAALLADALALRALRERDAVINLHIEPSVVSSHEPWDVLLPDAYSPLGWSWTQDIESREEAVAAVRRAAGLDREGEGDAP